MLPDDTFAGKRVLVTGGGTGVGLAISQAFGRAGAHVVIASRNPHHRRRGVEAVETAGGTASELFLDVMDVESIRDAFASEPCDVLVNNAAANFFAASETVSERGFGAIVDRVLKGAFFCSARFAERAIADGGGGAILNIVTGTALEGGPGVAASAAAKAGVVNLTKSQATEWARDGIRVNALAPGIFPHGDDAAGSQRLHFNDEALSAIPLGRGGEMAEIGWLATYLCSPYAGYITGQTMVIDGGASLPGQLVKPPFRPIREQIPPRL